jgi:hypothetical protein
MRRSLAIEGSASDTAVREPATDAGEGRPAFAAEGRYGEVSPELGEIMGKRRRTR